MNIIYSSNNIGAVIISIEQLKFNTFVNSVSDEAPITASAALWQAVHCIIVTVQ